MSTTWMIDGKAGEIVRLMGLAQAEVEAVTTETKGSGDTRMTFKGAEDIKRAARKVLIKHGIVLVWETSEQNMPTKALGELRVSATFIAPDGSSITHSINAAAYAGMGRHFTVAVTAGVKQIFGLALQLVVQGDDVEPLPEVDEAGHEEWSEALREVVAAIDASQDHQELNATTTHPCWKALKPEERGFAQTQGERRNHWLTRWHHGKHSKG